LINNFTSSLLCVAKYLCKPIAVDVVLEDETVWLSLNQLSDLFERDKSVISRHIKNILSEKELHGPSVVANFATTAK